MEQDRNLELLLKNYSELISRIETPVRSVVTEAAATKIPETDEERTLHRYMMSIRARKLLDAVDENGKNQDGYYYNPNTKEFDPNYNPLEDPRFRSTLRPEDTVDQVTRIEEIGHIQENIAAIKEQMANNAALANNESMKKTLEDEQHKLDTHITEIDQVVNDMVKLSDQLRSYQDVLEKQIALYTRDYQELQQRYSAAQTLAEKKVIRDSGSDVARKYGQVRQLERQLGILKALSETSRNISTMWAPKDLAALEDILYEATTATRIINDYKAKKEADVVIRYNETTNSYDVIFRHFDTISDEELSKGAVPTLHSESLSIPADEMSAEAVNKRIQTLRSKHSIKEMQDQITIVTFPDGRVVPTVGANIEMIVDETLKQESLDRRKDRKNKRNNKAEGNNPVNPNPAKPEADNKKPTEPAPEDLEEEKKNRRILAGLNGGEILRDGDREYEFDRDRSLAEYFKQGYDQNADGWFKNPDTGEYEKDYNPLNDTRFQLFAVYEVTRVLDPIETMQNYRNSGYDQNAAGYYYNPNTDEYEKGYDPLNDPLFQVFKNNRRRIGTRVGYRIAEDPNLVDQYKEIINGPAKRNEPTIPAGPVPPVPPIGGKQDDKKPIDLNRAPSDNKYSEELNNLTGAEEYGESNLNKKDPSIIYKPENVFNEDGHTVDNTKPEDLNNKPGKYPTPQVDNVMNNGYQRRRDGGEEPPHTPVPPVIVDTEHGPENPPREPEPPVADPSLLERNDFAPTRDDLLIRTILNKLEVGVSDESMTTKAGKKLKAQGIKLSPKGMYSLKEYDCFWQKVPKAIVNTVTYIPRVIIGGIIKAVRGAQTTAEDEASWQTYRDHFNHDLTDNERMALFKALQTTEVKRLGVTDAQALLLRDLVCQWASKRIQGICREMAQITDKVLIDATKYIELSNRLDDPNITPEVAASIEEQMRALTVGKADLLKARQNLLVNLRGYISGGREGFNQTMMDIISHQSFAGQHFAKGMAFDRERNMEQGEAESRLANAIFSDSPTRDTDAMLAFIEQEKIISDGTVFDGKVQVGSREYTDTIGAMNHTPDTFFRDWMQALAILAQGFAVGKSLANSLEAQRLAANGGQVQGQTGALFQRIRNDQGQVLDGQAAESDLIGGMLHSGNENHAIVAGNGSFKTAGYKQWDQNLHSVVEPQIQVQKASVDSIMAQYQSGAIDATTAMGQVNQVIAQEVPMLQDLASRLATDIPAYAQAHGFEYTGLLQTMQSLSSNAPAIAAGNNAMFDVFACVDQLEALVGNLPGLVQATGDMIPALLSSAAFLGLLCASRDQVKGKYIRDGRADVVAAIVDSIDYGDLAAAKGRGI